MLPGARTRGAFVKFVALAPGAIAHAVYSGHRYARELDSPPGTELYRRDAPIVEERPFLYDDGSADPVVV